MKPVSVDSSLAQLALGGLIGLTACSDSKNGSEPDPDQLVDAAVSNTPDAAAEQPDAASPYEVISEEQTTQSFAELTTECDNRGGYIQIHAACGGVNSCSGFSVGDWNPDVKSEHTCAGLNGCNGLSCVELPADSNKSASDILSEQLPAGGPAPCMNCHAEWTSDGPDTSVFKVYVWPGSGRTLDNWLDRSAEEQARVMAFGSYGTLPEGKAYANMLGYHKLYSRAEVERVITYIRTVATPKLVQIKVQDPE